MAPKEQLFVKKHRSPFDTSGRTHFSSLNNLGLRSWWGIEPWTEWRFFTFYRAPQKKNPEKLPLSSRAAVSRVALDLFQHKISL